MLTDLGLNILHAYISSDGSWFVDVFSVTDHHHHKVSDQSILERAENV